MDTTLMGMAAMLNGVDLSDEAAVTAFANEWIQASMQDIAALDAQTSNFYYMINRGDQHCVVNSDELFYGYSASGVALSDWFADFVNNQPSSVMCDLASGECYVPSAEGTSHP